MGKKARHSERADAALAKPVKNITLRMATARDATQLFDLLIHYFDDLALFYPQPVEAPTMAWGLSVVVAGAVVVAEEAGRLIGSVGLEWGQFPWSPTVKYLNGVWFYVAPEFRKGGTGDRLMKVSKDIADRNKVCIRLDNIWGIRPELQDRWRQMHGFQYVGGNHAWFPPAAGG